MEIIDGRVIVFKDCITVGIPKTFGPMEAVAELHKYYPSKAQIENGFVLEVASVVVTDNRNVFTPVAGLYFTPDEGVIHLSLEVRREDDPKRIAEKNIDCYDISDESANKEYREDLVNALVRELDCVGSITWDDLVGYQEKPQ